MQLNARPSIVVLLIVFATPASYAGGPVPITHLLEYNGMEYATMFDQDPHEAGTTCHGVGYMNNPLEEENWQVAANTPDSVFVTQYAWETAFLIMEDGSTYHTGPDHVGDRLYKGPEDDCGPRYFAHARGFPDPLPRRGCIEAPFWCPDWDCNVWGVAFCNAQILMSRPLANSNSAGCSAQERAQCSAYATCEKESGNVTCICRRGFEGDGTSCTDINECQDEAFYSQCHNLAYCDETPGSFACSCPEGFFGDGFTCANDAFGIRTVLNIPDVASYSALQLEALKTAYAMLILQDPALPTNSSDITSMPAAFGSTRFGERILGVAAPNPDSQHQITLTVLFPTQAHAAEALESLSDPDFAPLGGAAMTGPEIFRWVGGSTDDALELGPTGLDVTSVRFDPACMSTGCWVIDVTYTAGNDDFNVFYLPKAEASDSLSYDPVYASEDTVWPKSPSDTFLPANHPCTSMAYSADSGDLPATVTACCIPEFLQMYRPVQTFESALDGIANFSLVSCGKGETNRAVPRREIPSFVASGQTPDAADNTFPMPVAPEVPGRGIFVDGTFKGMNESRIDHKTALARRDSYVGIYQATLRLDERELRTLAGQLKGTVGLEHTVDTFVGLANFGPTGMQVLDTGAVQVNLHLEKTSFFTASTHGINDYTFLEYINLRLVAIYNEDADFSGSSESSNRTVRTDAAGAAHFVQVTFTLGDKYKVNEKSGLIPLASVRAGRGQFFEDAGMKHSCVQWTTGVFARGSDFNTTLQQRCAPASTMCVSPTSIPDSFVSFNIPLGVDFFGDGAATLSNTVFIDLVISAIDTETRGLMTAPNDGEAPWQMKTTLSASVPVVEGGINIFCDGITAKTDLKGVANVDIIVGAAPSAAELTRLRILEDVASTLAAEGPAQIDTDSIESGLMTLVIKGEESFFDLPGNREVSIELEDVISVHVMEDDGDGSDGVVAAEVLRMIRAPPDDNSNSAGLDTDGYMLNEAVSFRLDRRAQRAHLEASPALHRLCPWNPTRPQPGNAPLVSCVTRRDVQERGYPKRVGSVSTAMELCAAANPHSDQCDDDHPAGCCGALEYTAPEPDAPESKFMATILGRSDYAHQLAVDFAKAVDARYALNGRYRRAFWVNPGYQWTPTQSGGAALFSLSQKLFVLALISLDENIASSAGALGPDPSFTARRRMLLASAPVDPLAAQNSGAAAAETSLSFAVSPESMMANAFGSAPERVASFTVSVQLTRAEACLSPDLLQAKLRATLDDYLSSAATEYKTVQVTSLTVSRGDEPQCGSRRLSAPTSQRRSLLSASAYSSASAEVTMLVVFADGAPARFNQARFASMPGISSVEAAGALSPAISIDDGLDEQDWSWSDSAAAARTDDGENHNSTLLISSICGAIGAVVIISAGAVMWYKRRRSEEVSQTTVVTGVTEASLRHGLKGELSLASPSVEALRQELEEHV